MYRTISLGWLPVGRPNGSCLADRTCAGCCYRVRLRWFPRDGTSATATTTTSLRRCRPMCAVGGWLPALLYGHGLFVAAPSGEIIRARYAPSPTPPCARARALQVQIVSITPASTVDHYVQRRYSTKFSLFLSHSVRQTNMFSGSIEDRLCECRE